MWTSSGPSKTPSTVSVLPTSAVSSIAHSRSDGSAGTVHRGPRAGRRQLRSAFPAARGGSGSRGCRSAGRTGTARRRSRGRARRPGRSARTCRRRPRRRSRGGRAASRRSPGPSPRRGSPASRSPARASAGRLGERQEQAARLLPLLRAEPGVPRRAREPVGARGRSGTARSSTGRAPSRDHPPDEEQLLGVLLPEVGAARPGHVEEPMHDLQHAAEMTGPRRALERLADRARDRAPAATTPGGYTSSTGGAQTASTPSRSQISRSAVLVPRIRARDPRRDRTARGLTKIVTSDARGLARARAGSSDACPSCSAPIVGTRPTVRPSARQARSAVRDGARPRVRIRSTRRARPRPRRGSAGGSRPDRSRQVERRPRERDVGRHELRRVPPSASRFRWIVPASPRTAGPVSARAGPSRSTCVERRTLQRGHRGRGVGHPRRGEQRLGDRRDASRGRWTRTPRPRGTAAGARPPAGTARPWRSSASRSPRRSPPRRRRSPRPSTRPGRPARRPTSGNVWSGCSARPRAPASRAGRSASRPSEPDRCMTQAPGRERGRRGERRDRRLDRIVGRADHDELRRGGRLGGLDHRHAREMGSRRGLASPPPGDADQPMTGSHEQDGDRRAHPARADHRDLHVASIATAPSDPSQIRATGSCAIHASGPAGVGAPSGIEEQPQHAASTQDVQAAVR